MDYDDLNDKTAGHAVWLAVCVVYLCNTGISVLLDHLAGVNGTIVVGVHLDVNALEGNVALHTGNVV